MLQRGRGWCGSTGRRRRVGSWGSIALGRPGGAKGRHGHGLWRNILQGRVEQRPGGGGGGNGLGATQRPCTAGTCSRQSRHLRLESRTGLRCAVECRQLHPQQQPTHPSVSCCRGDMRRAIVGQGRRVGCSVPVQPGMRCCRSMGDGRCWRKRAPGQRCLRPPPSSSALPAWLTSAACPRGSAGRRRRCCLLGLRMGLGHRGSLLSSCLGCGLRRVLLRAGLGCSCHVLHKREPEWEPARLGHFGRGCRVCKRNRWLHTGRCPRSDTSSRVPGVGLHCCPRRCWCRRRFAASCLGGCCRRSVCGSRHSGRLGRCGWWWVRWQGRCRGGRQGRHRWLGR